MPDVLTVNQPAPDFALSADDGNTYRLQDFRGNAPVLLFFYPADFTPVCTAEVAAFRDDFQKFQDRGITLLGVSPDPIEKHERFSRECHVPFRLLSDVDFEVAKLYGARGLMGTRRAYYYIDRAGILRWQHAEVLPIFKMSNERILEMIDEAEKSGA